MVARISNQHKKTKFVAVHRMNIPEKFLFQLSKWFLKRSVLKHFPIRSNVKLSSAIAAILNFISEQKT